MCHNSIVATATRQEPARNFGQVLAGSGSRKQVKGDKYIMSYKDSLKPWAVVRLGKSLQWTIIARYKSRSDAEGQCDSLKRESR
jgi:hypothetical protein